MTADLSPAPRADRLDFPPPTPPRFAPVAIIRAVLYRVVVEPVRDGFPLWRSAPAGMAAIMVAAIVALGTALLLIGSAPGLRTWLGLELSPTGLSAPIQLVWLLVLLLIMALALLQAAALHAVWWGRVVGLLISTIYLCTVGLQSVPGPGGWGVPPGLDGVPGALTDLMIIAAALALLVGLTLVRARRTFSWWEFVVVLAVLTAATVLPSTDVLVLGLASDPGSYLTFAWSLLVNVGILAAPVVLAAGYGIAQFAYAGVVWTVDVVRAGVPRLVLVVIMVAVLGWRLYAEASAWWGARSLSAPRMLAALGLLISCWIVWTVLDAIADRVRTGATLPVHLGRDLQRVLLPIAVLLTLDLVLSLLLLSPPGYLAQLLDDAGQHGAAGAVQVAAGGLREVTALLGGSPARLGLALLIMSAGIWRAARGDRGTAELLGIVAIVLIFALYLGIEPATAYLPLLVVIIVTGLAVVWALARALTPHRAEALLVAALLSAIFGWRSVLADAGSVALGASVALIFGLLWGFLTGGQPTRQGGADLPRPARLLLFAGAALLGATAVAFVALISDPGNPFDANALAARGDSTLGGALLIGAMVAVVLAAVRDEDVGVPS